MPPKKKRRLQFPSPPVKSGIAVSSLHENCHVIPNDSKQEGMKNGHVLQIYVTSSRGVRQTCDRLAELCGKPFSDFKSSVTQVVNMTLGKYHRLRNKVEMEEVEKISGEKFIIVQNNSKLKDANPATRLEVSNSPMKAKRSAACRNCVLLRQSLRNSITKSTELTVKRKPKCMLKPKQLKTKLECRDAKIEKLKSKIAELQEIQSVSQVGKLEEELSKAERAKGRKDKKICELKKKLAKSNKEYSLVIKDLETHYQDRVLFLEEEIDFIKSESRVTAALEFKKTGKMHKFHMRLMVYDCLVENVPTDHIRPLLHSMALNFGVPLGLSDIPSWSSVENMMIELGIVSDLQAVEVIYKEACTVGFDASTQEGVHVNSIHATTIEACHVLSLEQLAGGTAYDYCDHVVRTVEHLVKVLVEFKPELDYAESKDTIIAHIQCTLTDRASVNHAAVRKI